MENKIWWTEYRKRIQKPNPANMSLEMILRNNIRKTVNEYLRNCSIAGVSKINDTKTSSLERVLRISVLALLFVSIIFFLRNLWFDNLAKPLIVNMESSTYSISNIEFPAVTLCNCNRISKKALHEYVLQHYSDLAQNNESIHEIETFCSQLIRLIDFSYNETLDIHPLRYSFAKHLGDTHNLIDLMKKLSPPCEEMLVRCSWSGDIVDCEKIFSVHRTARGHCCAFNLILTLDSNGRLNRTIYTVKRQHEPGQFQGLTVVLDTMVEDHSSYLLNKMMGIEVFMFDPTHFADPTSGRVAQRVAQPNQAAFFEIHSTKQVATREVRKYPPQTRQCLFHDDRKDEYNDLYSYSTCIIKCRTRTIESLCECTPFFYPISTKNLPICTLDNLKCLNKYKEKFYHLNQNDAENTLEGNLQDALYCGECLPDCEVTQHFTRHYKIPLTYANNENKEFISYFLEGINMSDKCLLNIYQATTDGVLNRLDVVLYWFEVVSNVGGFCSILVGFSIISILEFAYFFFLRFAINLYNFYNN